MFSDRPFLGNWPPLAIAHRGGGDPDAENTWAAFDDASQLGYRIIETDLRVTSDGHVVTFHDASLRRRFGYPNKICELTIKDLETVQVRGASVIPRLADVLHAYPGVSLNVDLKERDVIAPFVSVVERAGARHRVCVASFSDKRIRDARRLLGGDVATSGGSLAVAAHVLRSMEGHPGRRRPIRSFDALQVPTAMFAIPGVAPRLIDHSHRNGIHVHVWTVNEVADMSRLLDLGVDGVITDATRRLRDLLTARGQWPPNQSES